MKIEPAAYECLENALRDLADVVRVSGPAMRRTASECSEAMTLAGVDASVVDTYQKLADRMATVYDPMSNPDLGRY